MNQRQILLEEIKKAPDNILNEVLDFYQYLKSKSLKNDILVASESALKKDWLTEEENQEWQNL